MHQQGAGCHLQSASHKWHQRFPRLFDQKQIYGVRFAGESEVLTRNSLSVINQSDELSHRFFERFEIFNSRELNV